MKRLLASACLICTALSACTGLNYQRGIGFTGIDGEPKASATRTGGTVTRAAGPIQALAARPPQRLRVGDGDPGALAATAIAHGGQTGTTAVPATLGGAPMMLSTVEVNGVLHAVLRLPEGRRGRFADDAGAAFAGAVPRLTGCLAAGPTYRRDRPMEHAGLAVPLDCR
ncbi:hypothetical protein [Antarcticimicrobium luteum]|uniref:Lipoprotein n=1 Tax=Antarcticimicrobium luteum TaxID=2547397 RepID=A0A4R5UQB7_9RHOB|nr:hypothetical protein [Antarcticimicrobium luteum]TDK41086.1 hypothetical protein E1832_20525 [Antarcticimicrobium luteum]